MATIDQFKAALEKGGARNNLWNILIPGIDIKKILLVKSASLPATTLNAVSANFRGRTINFPGDQSPPADWTVTILNDEGFEIRNMFEKWINKMSNYTSWKGSSTGFKEDLIVTQLSRSGKELKKYSFLGAFPVSISEISLVQDAGAIEEFTVTFKVDLIRPENPKNPEQ